MNEVGTTYTSRLAVVYLRQSTEKQVRQNEGSRQFQEAQREHALRLGWRAADICVIDDDLGYSGLTTNRPGFRRLTDLIESGRVGGIFISDTSRAGRNDRAWLDFLLLLTTHDVMLFENGAPMDPHNPDQVMMKKLQALVVHRENQMRTANFHRGRLAKARSGRAVSAPPVGYLPEVEVRDGVPVQTGRWIKDPDPAVQHAIAQVFEAFRQGRSLPRAVRLLNDWNVKIPARRGW